jgi:hypothetical protein
MCCPARSVCIFLGAGLACNDPFADAGTVGDGAKWTPAVFVDWYLNGQPQDRRDAKANSSPPC